MKSALVILFNQDFSRNIPKLEAIYGGRFAALSYLVPDHHSATDRLYVGGRLGRALARPADRAVAMSRRLAGRRNPGALVDRGPYAGRIWKVCGHQFYFYDFLCQHEERLLALDADWIWVLGDDALLNPRIDGDTIGQFLGIRASHDAVMCRPVIGSDAWIRRMAGSVERAVALLRACLPRPARLDGIFPEPGAVENTSLPVACADFFGVRKDRLQDVFRVLRACFREKIYVELAVPNVLLAVCGSVFFARRFEWRRIEAEAWGPLVAALADSPDCVFAHPVKFSRVGEDELPRLARRPSP